MEGYRPEVRQRHLNGPSRRTRLVLHPRNTYPDAGVQGNRSTPKVGVMPDSSPTGGFPEPSASR